MRGSFHNQFPKNQNEAICPKVEDVSVSWEVNRFLIQLDVGMHCGNEYEKGGHIVKSHGDIRVFRLGGELLQNDAWGMSDDEMAVVLPKIFAACLSCKSNQEMRVRLTKIEDEYCTARDEAYFAKNPGLR
jgi:hypothetical protein